MSAARVHGARVQRRAARRRCGCAAVGAGLALAMATGPRPTPAQEPGDPLLLEEVLASIEATYPPLLAARIERDVLEGRLRTARGLFDLDLFGSAKGTPDGYYEYTTVEAGVAQFLGIWGATVYGGYRRTTGEELPAYYAQRTRADGEATVGVSVPVLQGGWTDPARTEIRRAEIDLRGAEPYVRRQRLDFVRAGTVAYFKWLAAGQKLQYARDLLRVATERTAALDDLVGAGLQAEIVLVDNRRLVVAREIAVLDAERAFQAAAVALSLFFRDPQGAPLTPTEGRLPPGFPDPGSEPLYEAESGLALALTQRPELERLRLTVERTEAELGLARNGLLPRLDASVETTRAWGERLYADRPTAELRAGLSFKLPLQQRKARGKVQEVRGKLEQARRALQFAEDGVAADVRTALVALEAARGQVARAELNVELALELEEAERARFGAGSSDLLDLQIREQVTFDARAKAAEASLEYFTAVAAYRAAVAAPPGAGIGGA